MGRPMPGHARAVDKFYSVKKALFVGVFESRDVNIWASTKPEIYKMKRVVEDLLFQVLIDQVMTQIYHLIEWLNTAPWQVWFA
jgi:hypothetical protein